LERTKNYCRNSTTYIGKAHSIDWLSFVHHYDSIRDLIEKTIAGFEDYNERVRQDGGFYLPNDHEKAFLRIQNKKLCSKFVLSKQSSWQLMNT
jgi:hypothetical protein